MLNLDHQEPVDVPVFLHLFLFTFTNLSWSSKDCFTFTMLSPPPPDLKDGPDGGFEPPQQDDDFNGPPQRDLPPAF
ncbi:hypothetical protein C8J56DRAFT_1058299 [Mycena floridula]|nr:hypothetical protein C8J56DRAFT_1058299 [Mycena floridula]